MTQIWGTARQWNVVHMNKHRTVKNDNVIGIKIGSLDVWISSLITVRFGNCRSKIPTVKDLKIVVDKFCVTESTGCFGLFSNSEEKKSTFGGIASSREKKITRTRDRLWEYQQEVRKSVIWVWKHVGPLALSAFKCRCLVLLYWRPRLACITVSIRTAQ